MALVLEQFLEKYGVKSSAHLSNPRIVEQSKMPWFRKSIIHYLDIDSANKFPNRNMYQLREMDGSKKIPVEHIQEMLYHEGTGPIIDRYIPNKIKKWQNTHLKTFRTKDLVEDPTKDIHIASIVNHNAYKDKFDYVSARTAFVNKHYNYLKTYADTLKRLVKGRPDFYHVISFNIPPIIPGFKAMMKLMSYNEARLGLVVDDPHLFWFFELYKWNSSKFRAQSVFRGIDDNDAKSIIIEFKSKGFSCFLPLYVLRGLSKDSSLPSNLKLDDVKSTKFLTLFALRLQSAIEEAYGNSSKRTEVLRDEDGADPVNYVDDELEEAQQVINADEEDDIDPSLLDPTEVRNLPRNIANDKKQKDKLIRQLDNSAKIMSGITGDDLFDDIDGLDDMSADMFNLINDGITIDKPKKTKKVEFKEKSTSEEEAEEEKEDKEIEATPEEVIEKINKDQSLTEDEKFELLRTKTVEERINDYVKQGELSSTITSSEIRTIRGLQERRTRLKDPFEKSNIDEYVSTKIDNMDFKGDDVKIEINNRLVDDTFKTNKIKAFDDYYLKNRLKRDIVSCVSHLEQSGIVITNYEVEEVKTAVDNYQLHRISLQPLKGKASTVYFRLPIIDDHVFNNATTI